MTPQPAAKSCPATPRPLLSDTHSHTYNLQGFSSHQAVSHVVGNNMPAKGEKDRKERALEDVKLLRIYVKKWRDPKRLTSEDMDLWMKYIRSGRAKYIPITLGHISLEKGEHQFMMGILSRNAPSRANKERRRVYDQLMRKLRRNAYWYTTRIVVPPTYPNARPMRKKLTRTQLTATRQLMKRGYRS